MNVINKAKADKCNTASRSKSKMKHRNYSNKYTKLLGQLGYKGIKSNGYFTKFYSYGVVGHCAPFVQYWLIKCGYKAFVPKKGYIWNTNKFASWLKKAPTIKGYGKVQVTTDPAKAIPGAICFKGKKKGKSYNHTCYFLKYEGGYIYTVDGNVSGTYKGKKINNGVEKKRKASNSKWLFCNMPYKITYELLTNMNVRADHSTASKVKKILKAGTIVKATEYYKTHGGVEWAKTKDGWICIRTKTKVYLKERDDIK